MSHNLGKWSSMIHTHYLRSGESFTAAAAVGRFGEPTTTISGESLLDAATASGYFIKSEQSFGGERVRKYRAIPGAAAATRRSKDPKQEPESYFDGLKKVRSIFELGDA